MAADFAFTPPSQREDNTNLPESEIKEYKLYINGIYKKTIPKTPYTFSVQLPSGSELSMKTVDTNGQHSVLNVPYVMKAAPLPPTAIIEQ